MSFSAPGNHPMRIFLLTCATFLTCVGAHAELYLQKSSVSPDGTAVFAINYPPTKNNAEGWAQGCFLHPRSKKPIGSLFFLPDTDANTDHPGSYSFDNYRVFEYVWSADSHYVAVTLNRRRWSSIYPFRRRRSAFQMLIMPNLYSLLEPHLKEVIQVGLNTSIRAERWTKDHLLVASITKDGQTTQSGQIDQGWKEHSITATILFARDGAPRIKETEFCVDD